MSPLEEIEAALSNEASPLHKAAKDVLAIAKVVVEREAVLLGAETEQEGIERGLQQLHEDGRQTRQQAQQAQQHDRVVHLSQAMSGKPFEAQLSTAGPFLSAEAEIQSLVDYAHNTAYPIASRNTLIARIDVLEAKSRYFAHMSDTLLRLDAQRVTALEQENSSIVLDPQRGVTGEHRRLSAEYGEQAQRFREDLAAMQVIH